MYWVNASYPANDQPADGQPRVQPARRLSYAATMEILPQ
jgi:hypothetical protein